MKAQAAPETAVQRAPAEQQFAAELDALAKSDKRQRPTNWKLSPWAVLTYLMGGKADDGTAITPKYVGQRRLMEIAVATLATDRALLLLGLPGTAKSWVSEHSRRRSAAIPRCWCRAPPAPRRNPSATAGTTRCCSPRGRAARRWCRAP